MKGLNHRRMSFITLSIVFILIVYTLSGCTTGNIRSEETTIGSSENLETTTISSSEAILSNPEEWNQFELTALQEDFNQLINTIDYYHPKLYTDQEALKTLIDQQYSALKDGMTVIDFYQILAPVVSELRCGHTGIYLSSDDFDRYLTSSKYLPFNLYWTGKQAVVSETGDVPGLTVGAEVLRINDVPIEKVLTGMLENLSADGENLTLKMRAINDGFRYYYAIDNNPYDSLSITYKPTPDASPITEMVTLKTQSELIAANRSIWGQMMTYGFSNQTRFEADYAVLRMASFYPDGGETVTSYNAFIDTFFQEVAEKTIDTIIIDVRNNFGGDPNVAAHLFSYLEKEPVPYFAEGFSTFYPTLASPVPLANQPFTGKVYVLMNGNCFSTTGHFLALLKYHEIGTLIGEESGGSFACTDASRSMALKHTQLQFRYSTKIFQVAVDGLTPGRGIMPDIQITPTLEDILSKKDLEMEKANARIKGN